MTPLERMAKAHWDARETDDWFGLEEEDRAYLTLNMRAALLSLAEAELPKKMVERVKDDLHDGIDVIEHIVETSSLAKAFENLIRAIAEEKTNDTQG